MEQTQKKSTFISVLSWILIALTGFGLLISVMQNIMVRLIFNTDGFKDIPNTPDNFPDLIFSNFDLLILFVGLIILYSFISAIGLLKRKNWARVSYIVLFGFAIIYMIGMVIFQWVFTNKVNSEFNMPDDEFNSIFLIMRLFMVVLTIGLCVLFGWLTRKLLSKKIKAEFTVQTEHAK